MTPSRELRVRLAAGDLAADAGTVCADVVRRVRACGARLVRADVVATPAEEPQRLDLAVLDGIARLGLGVRRAGADLVLCAPGAEVRLLLAFTGLEQVLATEPSAGEAQREAEEAEQVRAEEVRDAADPAVPELEQVDGPRLADATGSAGLVLGEPP